MRLIPVYEYATAAVSPSTASLTSKFFTNLGKRFSFIFIIH